MIVAGSSASAASASCTIRRRVQLRRAGPRSCVQVPRPATGMRILVATRTAASARFDVDTSSTASGASSANSFSNAISARGELGDLVAGRLGERILGRAPHVHSLGFERSGQVVRAVVYRRRSGSSCRNPYQAAHQRASHDSASSRVDRVRCLMRRLLAPLNLGRGRHPPPDLVPQLPDHGRDPRRGPHADPIGSASRAERP